MRFVSLRSLWARAKEVRHETWNSISIAATAIIALLAYWNAWEQEKASRELAAATKTAELMAVFANEKRDFVRLKNDLLESIRYIPEGYGKEERKLVAAAAEEQLRLLDAIFRLRAAMGPKLDAKAVEKMKAEFALLVADYEDSFLTTAAVLNELKECSDKKESRICGNAGELSEEQKTKLEQIRKRVENLRRARINSEKLVEQWTREQ